MPGLSDLGRYSEPALLILVSLAAGPKHGYAMMDDIATWSGVMVGPGTLYAALARLERLGFIEPLEPANRRRPYRLSNDGAAALQAELARLGRITAAGRCRLGAP